MRQMLVVAPLAVMLTGGFAMADRYTPGARVLVDAHNAYPSDGKFSDRIDRALSTGVPLAIEQDLVWYKRSGDRRRPIRGLTWRYPRRPGGGGDGADPRASTSSPRSQPIMKKALAENRRDDWPLITLNLDFKTNEPEHHATVWALLGKYESWLTTAERTATPKNAAPLRLGPMLVLTGSNDAQQVAFHDTVTIGQRLRLFGAIPDVRPPGANRAEQAKNYPTVPAATLIPAPPTNYRRWVNFSWAVVEAGGARQRRTGRRPTTRASVHSSAARTR